MPGEAERSFHIGPVKCSPHSIGELLESLQTLLRCPNGSPRSILCINAHIYNMAYRNRGLCRQINSARIVAVDGISIVWAARLLGHTVPSRCNMTEAFRSYIGDANMPPVNAVLVGCTDHEVEQAAAHIRATCSHCCILAAFSGFLSDDEYRSNLSALDNAALILIGAGTPRSEQLAEIAAEVCPKVVAWHIGAGTIRMLAGTVREAPPWMRKTGLQWVHRLCLEPRLMWRRYILGNPAFILRIACLRFRARADS